MKRKSKSKAARPEIPTRRSLPPPPNSHCDPPPHLQSFSFAASPAVTALGFSIPKLTRNAFQFLDPGALRDAELKLILRETTPAMSGRVPTYRFEMMRHPDHAQLGGIDLRIGHTSDVLLYSGHIGYRVHQPHRGHRYAARASILLYPLAKRHGIEE